MSTRITTRRTTQRAAATIAAALVFAAVGTPAQGAESGGSCPAPFQAYTLKQLVKLAASVDVSRDSAERTFAYFNKNEDAIVCVQPVPNEAGFNFIDNNAS